MHMKRTNLVLDEHLLEEASRLTGGRTWSGTVNFALADLVRRAKARQILQLSGSGLWEGNLAEMRRDRPVEMRRDRPVRRRSRT
jgi:Arc/MetJ family transcription regulator